MNLKNRNVSRIALFAAFVFKEELFMSLILKTFNILVYEEYLEAKANEKKKRAGNVAQSVS